MKYVPPAIVRVENGSKIFGSSRKASIFESAKGDGASDSMILPTRTVGPAYSTNY